MQRVAIVGLGLIGGSIGLGLRRWAEENGQGGHASLEIVGFDTDLQQQQYAKKLHAVDKTAWQLVQAVRDADVVVIATPVLAMRDVFSDIAPHLKSGAVVTDTGSTKVQVLAWANELLPRTVNFVGGHPMAGKSQSIEAAEADLFKGATWCVTPSVSASEDAIRNVLGIVAALSAEPYFIDPAEHDAYVAGVSHLPFVLSAALMNAVSRDASWRDMKTLTSTGFRDVTRLAAGSPDMHRDILLTNRDAVRRWIDNYIASLTDLRRTLEEEGDEATKDLGEFFEKARDARADWSTQTTREGELLQGTSGELSPETLSEQMGRMLLGGFAKRRRNILERKPGQREPNGKSDDPRTR